MKHRVFIAINLPNNLKMEILKLQQKLFKFDWPVKWEPADKIHLTLRFIGNISEKQIEAVKKLISMIVDNSAPFTLSIDNFIVLPNFYEPHAICLSFEESEPLYELQSRIAEAFEEQGIGESERHPFTAHLTIGRTKPIRVNYRALTKMEFKRKFEVKSVEIIESTLQQEGSIYKIMQSFNLTGRK